MPCKCGHSASEHIPVGPIYELMTPCMICGCEHYDLAPKQAGISSDPYPDLWARTRRYLKEKHPDLRGIPSREMLIDLLLKEAGF